MTMQFHYHPLSSFCWKVLIALYEKNAAFEPVIVNLGDAEAAAAFIKLSPMRKMPAIVNGEDIVNESSIQIEYLDQTLGGAKLIPADPKQALEARYWDRFFDLYAHHAMQSLVANRMRPADLKDKLGIEETRKQMQTAYDVIDKHMAGRTWAAGEAFSLADCSAAPALYYANKVAPFEASHPNIAAYLTRLRERPSFARALKEAEPYFHLFPQEAAA